MRTLVTERQAVTENQSSQHAPAVSEMDSTAVYASQFSYHEMADVPVQEIDVLQALENNLNQLDVLQSRMQFMMREIRYLMKV